MIYYYSMNNKAKVPKIYDLMLAFFIITICILGSQLLFQHIRGELEHQKGDNTSSTITHSPSSTNNTPSSSISIPLSKGYVHGKTAFFIATDASDNQVAESITKNTGFKVNFAPDLALTPDSARQQGYDFVNGIKTSGSPMGFQLGIASALPGEKGYSPLNQVNFVKWNANTSPRLLKSAAEILAAERNGELIVAKTNIVINSPAVVQGSLVK
jgi:hypothetical protein